MEKVKLIQGNPERAEEIRKTLEEWGGEDVFRLDFNDKYYYFYIDVFGNIDKMVEASAYNCIKKGKAEIYELPPLQPKCEFKPFDKVLVRDYYSEYWGIDLFINFDEDEYKYQCFRSSWNKCIKYEGNEELLGTKDNPKRL